MKALDGTEKYFAVGSEILMDVLIKHEAVVPWSVLRVAFANKAEFDEFLGAYGLCQVRLDLMAMSTVIRRRLSFQIVGVDLVTAEPPAEGSWRTRPPML